MMKNTVTHFLYKIETFIPFAKQQKRSLLLMFSLLALLFLSIISLIFIHQEYIDKLFFYKEINKKYLSIQQSRLNTLSSIQKEEESIVSFFNKKQFDKPFKNAQAQKIIEKIKRQLRLENCRISSAADILIDKELNIFSKKIIFEIQSNTDQKFYQLVDRLHHQMPGLIIVKKFSVQKSPMHTKVGNYLFQGKIECLWIRQKRD
jgi:hypothetical protein